MNAASVVCLFFNHARNDAVLASTAMQLR